METLYYTMIVASICGGLAVFALQCLFYRRLRRHHTDVWQSLGRPGLFGTVGSTWAVIRFLGRRAYRSLPDAHSVRLAGLYHVCVVLYLALAVSTVVVLVVRAWTRV